jgi:hypothetical protein
MSDSDQIVFFIDRALGKNHVPNALRDIGETVEIHDAHLIRTPLIQIGSQLLQEGAGLYLLLTKK